MHEGTLVSALLARVEEEAAARGSLAVQRVVVSLGELAGVEAELFATAWEAFRTGTRCAAAELALRPEAARWECPRCGAPLPRGGVLRCVDCAVPARLAAGDGLVLLRIEMEVPDV